VKILCFEIKRKTICENAVKRVDARAIGHGCGPLSMSLPLTTIAQKCASIVAI
jgi:hypothetical protein